MNICNINHICVSADGIIVFFLFANSSINTIQWALVAIIFNMAKVTSRPSPHSISLQS
jgi:hypothetical protein